MKEIKYSIATGMIGAGEPLPSVRQMAVQLRINPNTVARAYRELEREGVVVTIRGKGVYVSDAPRSSDKGRALADVKHALDSILVEAFHTGISADEVREALEQRIKNLKSARAK